MSQMEKYRKKL